MMKLKIASRKSALALWQAHFIGKQLQKNGLDYEILEVSTEGDRVQNRYLHEIGGKGLFVKEVERALHDQRADLAVHSLKDMPVNLSPDFAVVATPERHERHDILLLSEQLARQIPSLNFASLKSLDWQGLKFGTSSLRRRYQFKKNFSAENFAMLRGNVNTRLQKLLDGEFDAIVLAAASLDRLGLEYPHIIPLPVAEFIPCAGQGALAVQMFSQHPALTEVQKLNHAATFQEVGLERAILRALGGDCTMPCGIHAKIADQTITVYANVLDQTGRAAAAQHIFDLNVDSNQQIATIMHLLKDSGLQVIFNNLHLKLGKEWQ